MATSPTQLSLAWLKKEGYLAEVVERWIPGANMSVKTSGVGADIVAIRDGETVAVQCTSWDNISSRCKKIAESDTVGPVRKAGWNIWVVGWKKKDNRWVHKLIDCS
jgi:hypothetical protein